MLTSVLLSGGLHLNPNMCWPVSSQLRADHLRGCGPVDPVDDDRGAARNFARVTSNEYEQKFTDIAVKAGVFFPDGHDTTALNQPLPTLS